MEWYNRNPQVGEEVYKIEYNSFCVGTIIKVTAKRKQMVVDFGNYTERYDNNGCKIGGYCHKAWIHPYTREAEEKFIAEKTEIANRRRCTKRLEKLANNTRKLSYDDILKVLKFLDEISPEEGE